MDGPLTDTEVSSPAGVHPPHPPPTLSFEGLPAPALKISRSTDSEPASESGRESNGLSVVSPSSSSTVGSPGPHAVGSPRSGGGKGLITTLHVKLDSPTSKSKSSSPSRKGKATPSQHQSSLGPPPKKPVQPPVIVSSR